MKNYLHSLIINMFLIQKLVNNLFKNNHIIILWNILQVEVKVSRNAVPVKNRCRYGVPVRVSSTLTLEFQVH